MGRDSPPPAVVVLFQAESVLLFWLVQILRGAEVLLNRVKTRRSFFCIFRWCFLRVAKQALIHGLNRHYYSIAINYRKNELEEKMLLNLHKKKKWADGLTLKPFEEHSKSNEQTVKVRFFLSPAL